jgi:hypothetical protein
LVAIAGVPPARVSPQNPKFCASGNFAIPPLNWYPRKDSHPQLQRSRRCTLVIELRGLKWGRCADSHRAESRLPSGRIAVYSSAATVFITLDSSVFSFA